MPRFTFSISSGRCTDGQRVSNAVRCAQAGVSASILRCEWMRFEKQHTSLPPIYDWTPTSTVYSVFNCSCPFYGLISNMRHIDVERQIVGLRMHVCMRAFCLNLPESSARRNLTFFNMWFSLLVRRRNCRCRRTPTRCTSVHVHCEAHEQKSNYMLRNVNYSFAWKCSETTLRLDMAHGTCELGSFCAADVGSVLSAFDFCSFLDEVERKSRWFSQLFALRSFNRFFKSKLFEAISNLTVVVLPQLFPKKECMLHRSVELEIRSWGWGRVWTTRLLKLSSCEMNE